jgi:hypothetical protein
MPEPTAADAAERLGAGFFQDPLAYFAQLWNISSLSVIGTRSRAVVM